MVDRPLHRTWTPAGWAGVFLLSVLGLAACQSTSRLDAPGAGKTLSYSPGVPNFDVELQPGLREETLGVDMFVSIPRMSLIFVQEGGRYRAAYELRAEVYDAEGERLILDRTWNDSLTVERYERTQDYRPVDLQRRIAMEPGTYVFRVLLVDRETGKEAVRLTRVTVPDFRRDRPVLAPLYVQSKGADGRFRTMASLHLRSGRDSIRVASELYNATGTSPVDVDLVLVRYETDGEVAIPPYWLSPNRGSLGYHGVDYGRVDTVEEARYRIGDVGAQAEIRFTLPTDLSTGMYRITVRARMIDSTARTASTGAAGSGERPGGGELVESRDLSVKGSDFPSIAELDEVIDALEYIARDRELEEIRSGPNVSERRRRFDAFWGEMVGNRETASDLIQQYYSRVEEANLMFTTYKEGWKTDRGMVYIVKGAPLFVEQYFEAEVWHYSYSQDPRQTYVFERVRPYQRQGLQLDNYILMRRPYYEQPWREAVQRWREGRVL